MKNPTSYGTNTTTPAGRANGQFINDPGGGLGSGVVAEADNDNIYAVIAPIESYKDGGISDTDETTLASDMRDTLEEMTEKRVTDTVGSATVAEWLVGTSYILPGEDLVTWKGYQFINFSNVANLGNDPLISPTVWFKIPKSDILMDQFFSGQALSGGLSLIADRADVKYLQNLDFGQYRLGGNGDDFALFSRVALDGTVVTGDTVLEDDIFKEGTADEYWNIDIIAPDVVGTRTLLDLGEYIVTPQSVSGENDTLGELQEDRGQGHWHGFDKYSTTATGGAWALNYAAGADSGGAGLGNAVSDITNIISVVSPIADGVNGTPRTGLTTRPKELTEGISYIIVMNVL